MGARKAIKAEKIKAEKKQKAIAILRDCPTSPRKMRLVADIIRGVEINKALGILRFSKKERRSAWRNFSSRNRQLGGQERERAPGRYETVCERGVR